jgi:23S rRNA (adenine2503-C2)-methyltransferase
MIKKVDLRNFAFDQLNDYLTGQGLPPSRARQIFSWLSRPGISEFSQMTDIKKEVRTQLAEQAFFSGCEAAGAEHSSDGTTKFAFRLVDGAVIESVLIPEDGRHTLCVSSQTGCAMGCSFCTTGSLGPGRNLSPAEIVNQVMAVLEQMVKAGVVRTTPRELVNNLVFMGMGEPLANYEHVRTALAILMDERGLGFSERRVTISTCGIIPVISRLGRDLRVNLAVSLHAADDETRSRLMPVNRIYPLADLLTACREYPLGRKKVILFQYLLLKDINDSPQEARLLSSLLQAIPSRINLLPYNGSASLDYECPSMERILEFQKILRQAGLPTFIRSSRGADIAAACGQLAGRA